MRVSLFADLKKEVVLNHQQYRHHGCHRGIVCLKCGWTFLFLMIPRVCQRGLLLTDSQTLAGLWVLILMIVMRPQETCIDFTSYRLLFPHLCLRTCRPVAQNKSWRRNKSVKELCWARLAFHSGFIKSDSFSRVRCGQPALIDKSMSPEIALRLGSIQNWFTSTIQLMKSVQVKLQSSSFDMHLEESVLGLTSACCPQLKPGGKLSYKEPYERDGWPLWQCACAIHKSS